MRRSLVGAIALTSVHLAACDQPTDDPFLSGDGGVSAATGAVTVHTETANLPLLVARVSVSLGAFQLHSDREPTSFASADLLAPLDFQTDPPTSLEGALPATYGSVRLVGVDELRVVMSNGHVLVLPFDEVAPIDVRCAGAGTYLPTSGAMDVTLALDVAVVDAVLDATLPPLYYPPTGVLMEVVDVGMLATVYDALASSLSATCVP